MKKSSKIILGIVITLLILVSAIFIFIKVFATKSLPDYESEVTIPGMSSEVTVYRDNYGIPHIYAETETDLYRALGYVMAQDRLWQMDLIRRVTQGRLSEIFGEKYVDSDVLLRALRIPEKSNIILDSLDNDMVQMLYSFAEGVNYYMQNENLPIEFKLIGYKPDEWLPQQSINIIGYIGWDLGTAWSSEILAADIKSVVDSARFNAIIPDFKGDEIIYDFCLDSIKYELENQLITKTELVENLGIQPLMASNNWAVSGKKSETGSPILANDMHLGYGIPGIWYQVHLVVEGKLNVTGLTIPGAPGIVAGHNENIAWGMTNVMLDDIDFYMETINPENPNQYKFNGEWEEMEVKTEIIKTKEGNEIEKKLYFTHRGPIISEIKKIKDKSISMRWIGNEYSNEFRTIYLLNRASNWEDFKDAIKTFISVSQNIVYADKEGNIGMYCAAGVPIRKGDGISIYNGETDEYDWKRFVPFDSLPHEYNPERGYVSSANNSFAKDYPYYISFWTYQDYRIKRIREMLESKEKLSIQDFENMHSDFKSKLVEMILPDIIYNASSIASEDETVKKSLEILSTWNGILNTDSPAATIFEEFYITLAKNLATDELGDELTTKFLSNKRMVNNLVEHVWANKYTYWCDNVTTKDTLEIFSDIVNQSYLQAIENLKLAYGENPEKWYWGNIHTLELVHPLSAVKILDFAFNLNRGPYGVGGSNHTVCPYSYQFGNKYITDNGASHRSIFSFANFDESLTIIPTGESGQPASEFYCDQTELFVNNKYHADYFSKDKVIENKKYEMKIK